MSLPQHLLELLFPPKCVLCRRVLRREQTDLCPQCRADTPEANCRSRRIPHLAKLSALWYYEGSVRNSILHFKFRGKRNYGQVYGRLLAMHLLQQEADFQLITWVPISRRRKWLRGYDQVELIAQSLSRELGIPALPLLQKTRHNRAQSSLTGADARRANVLGVYRVLQPSAAEGKTILLVDDIVTTGATISECARTLLSAGAGRIWGAAVAVSPNQRKNSR